MVPRSIAWSMSKDLHRFAHPEAVTDRFSIPRERLEYELRRAAPLCHASSSSTRAWSLRLQVLRWYTAAISSRPAPPWRPAAPTGPEPDIHPARTSELSGIHAIQYNQNTAVAAASRSAHPRAHGQRAPARTQPQGAAGGTCCLRRAPGPPRRVTTTASAARTQAHASSSRVDPNAARVRGNSSGCHEARLLAPLSAQTNGPKAT